MRGLNQFQFFNWDLFAKDKVFIVVGNSEYSDYESKQHLGSKVECIIALDNTNYEYKNGNVFTNRYEKICFKVRKDVNIPLDTRVVPKGVTARVYGDYRNQLSVVCEDIEVASVPTQGTTKMKKEL